MSRTKRCTLRDFSCYRLRKVMSYRKTAGKQRGRGVERREKRKRKRETKNKTVPVGTKIRLALVPMKCYLERLRVPLRALVPFYNTTIFSERCPTNEQQLFPRSAFSDPLCLPAFFSFPISSRTRVHWTRIDPGSGSCKTMRFVSVMIRLGVTRSANATYGPAAALIIFYQPSATGQSATSPRIIRPLGELACSRLVLNVHRPPIPCFSLNGNPIALLSVKWDCLSEDRQAPSSIASRSFRD